MMSDRQNFKEISVERVAENRIPAAEKDAVAVEEPLEIRVGFKDKEKLTHKSVSVTMRTPGDDFELAAGFLFTEGIIDSAAQIRQIRHCGVPSHAGALPNTVRVDLRDDVRIDLKKLERHFYTSSSCGVCGKTSIEAVKTGISRVEHKAGLVFRTEMIHRLPEILRAAQSVFERTGGLHAAALFGGGGEMECVREDVGRHNAVDKLIGRQFLAGKTPLAEQLLFVSGRASFELVQKALMAGIPAMAAVGAPSSLAVELAREYGMTLLGFVRDERFNIYSGAERIRGASREEAQKNKSGELKPAKVVNTAAQ